MKSLSDIAIRLLCGLLRVYQKAISPFLGPHCRFEPSCSAYATGALQTHGLGRGAGLTVWRLLRCQPFCTGGLDPVPPRKKRVDKVWKSE